MTLLNLTYTLLFLAACVLLWRHLNISRRAYQHAISHTKKHGVSLLDQSVVLKKMRIARSKATIIAVERQFQFEFSSVGDVRYVGCIIFSGARLKHIDLAPYKSNESELI